MKMASKEPGGKDASYLKYMSLVVLTFQNALLIVSMRYTRVLAGDMYFPTTAVFISETLKMVICLLIIWWQQPSFSVYLSLLHKSLLVDWVDMLKMSVPAIVYMVQNNLQYVAVSNLEAAVFQVTYQLKILTTAMFSVFMLKKELSALKWGSLVVLFLGVALVQLENTGHSSSSQDQNHLLGLTAVVISCLSSGFAGVYFEKMLKGSDTSVWMRNVQLGIFGSTTALISLVAKDGSAIAAKGFFFGYTPLVVFVVVQQAVGGLIVAVVVRYADNILKGFSTSLSIIISCIASIFLFGFVVTLTFFIGAVLVIVSIYMYGRPQQAAASKWSSPPPVLPVSVNPSSTNSNSTSSATPHPTMSPNRRSSQNFASHVPEANKT